MNSQYESGPHSNRTGHEAKRVWVEESIGSPTEFLVFGWVLFGLGPNLKYRCVSLLVLRSLFGFLDVEP